MIKELFCRIAMRLSEFYDPVKIAVGIHSRKKHRPNFAYI